MRIVSSATGPSSASMPSKLSSSERWVLKIIYLLAVISFIVAYGPSQQTRRLIADLETKKLRQERNYQDQVNLFQDLQAQIKHVDEMLEPLRKTHSALQHEVQVIRELYENGEDSSNSEDHEGSRVVEYNLEATHLAYIDQWLERRTYGLKRRIEFLQHYLQLYSQQQVIQKYV